MMYIDSVRVNLGLFQHDTNVIYDLAPHDLSIMSHLIDAEPVSVRAMGTSHTGNEIESLAYLHIEFGGELVAHIHVNWMAPVKVRRMLICGTRKMIVYDDTEPSEKVLVYDRGIDLKEGDVDSLYRAIVDYRTGDMVAPKLVHREALNTEAEHFLSCVRNRERPLCDGLAGLRVVRILEAAQTSLRAGGERVALGRR
jgi:predicted dehydrogenase